MNSSTHFFILYIIVCFSIILLFYFLFKRSEVPHTGTLTKKIPTPYEFLRRKMNKGIPGMDLSELEKPLSISDPLRRKMNKDVPDSSELGKPLPAPKMPVAPVPLIVRV